MELKNKLKYGIDYWYEKALNAAIIISTYPNESIFNKGQKLSQLTDEIDALINNLDENRILENVGINN